MNTNLNAISNASRTLFSSRTKATEKLYRIQDYAVEYGREF
jgi:hypothetical protein